MVEVNREPGIVVIGASAGGLSPLRQIVHTLSPDLSVPVVVVMHQSLSSPRLLANILNMSGNIPAVWAQDGAALHTGHIYIAPPDRHVLVKGGRIQITNGPRENFVRPSIDPTLRSATRTYGSRVIAVILSGALNDGTYGAMSVKAHGGTVIVQDPFEADTPDMPQSVIQHTKADYVAKAVEIGPLLARLVAQPLEGKPVSHTPRSITDQDDNEKLTSPDNPPPGTLAPYVCPECGGSLWLNESGQLVHFRCHTGHAFTSDVLLRRQSEVAENALWSAVRVMDERVLLLRRLGQSGPGLENSEIHQRYMAEADALDKNALLIRNMLLSGAADPSPIEHQRDGQPKSS